ncbi:protein-methionine sulfoxide oxidase mical3a-like isoform X3 [Watersipora subatra]
MAGVGKVKALQIWCKNRVAGYRDVEITNMTTSWRSGMAFCALIHRFRPELIDYDSLSKENVFENNELAFSVAEGIGVPALLDAEDMVRLEVPDKLSIITYVAQLHNCFKDEVAAGGPGVKTASKRPSAPVQRSVTMRSPESKRRPKLGMAKKSESSPAVGSAPEMCELCDGKVYLIEKHMVDGKLYHRSCFKRSNHKPDVSSLSASHKTSQKSTPGRPSALPSKDLKKTPSSLPSTPNTPPDTRPDWQKKLQEKSLAKRVAASAMPRSGSLETLPEDHAAAPAAKPSPALQTVKLRSKASNASKTPTPRAVSVGVDLDERIVKLRQLRESAKAASSGAGNAAVKARLERLQKIASKECAADTKKAQSSKSTTQNETAADRRSARIHDCHKDSSKLEQVDGQSSMETSMEAESELPSSQTHTEGSSKNKDNVQFNSQNDACVDNKPSSDLPKSEENTNPFETETEEKPTDTLIEAGEVSTRSNDEPLVNRTRVVINTPSGESILTVESGQPTIGKSSTETAAPAVPSAAPSSAPIRPKRSHNMKARPASDSPSKDVTSHSKQSAGAADGASSSHTGLTSNFLDVANASSEPAETGPEPTETFPEPAKTTNKLSEDSLAFNLTPPRFTEIALKFAETSPEPTNTVPRSTEASLEPTNNAPKSTETSPEPTSNFPKSTETSSEPTNTAPKSTETSPEPINNVPKSTETSPEPTNTAPKITDSVPEALFEPTEIAPESTEAVPRFTEALPSLTGSAAISAKTAHEAFESVTKFNENETVPESFKPVPTYGEQFPELTQASPEFTEMVPNSNQTSPLAAETISESTQIFTEISKTVSKCCETVPAFSVPAPQSVLQLSETPEYFETSQESLQISPKTIETATEPSYSASQPTMDLVVSTEKYGSGIKAIVPFDTFASEPVIQVNMAPGSSLDTLTSHVVSGGVAVSNPSLTYGYSKNMIDTVREEQDVFESKKFSEPEQNVIPMSSEVVTQQENCSNQLSAFEESASSPTADVSIEMTKEPGFISGDLTKSTDDEMSSGIKEAVNPSFYKMAEENDSEAARHTVMTKFDIESSYNTAEQDDSIATKHVVATKVDSDVAERHDSVEYLKIKDCKPKPVRPPRSPAASKRQNKNADTHSQVLSPEIELSQQVAHNIDNSQPKKLESESTSSVSKVKVAEGKIETPSHKMSNQKSQVSTDKERSTTPPARPRTNAAGSASKSHFYMDKEHKTVTEPPPKPARQPALSKELGDWQESLVNWSAKRKGKKEKTEKPHSTFYTDAYPTENNPFGEDDEDVMPEVSTTNQNNSEKVSDGYEAALNPFAEDSSPANPFEEEEDTTPVELPTKHKVKLMPGNPFEVSDDDDDEPKEEVSKRKITPDSDLFIEQPKTTRTNRHNKIILPDTSDRKITPKKKLAPPPPTPPSLQNRLSEEQTPVISDDKENTTVTLQESKQTINETTPTDKFIEQDESKFHDISDDEGVSIESQKRKHRPAPPRPMPPKRRPPTNYGVGPEELAKELAAIEDKQRHLEEEGRRLEKAIRTADEAMDKHSVSNADDDDELISRWLETVNEKNHLVRREAELVFIAKHQALESQQADLEWELREIMNQAENLKTDDDKLREEDLLQKLVTVVTERSKLVDKMDEERLR